MSLVVHHAHSSVAHAQGSAVLTGTVRDASTRAPVPDVVVVVTSPALQGEQVVVTDASGQYRAPQLPPGEYTVHLEKETYRPADRSGVTLRGGSTIRLNIELLPESIKAEDIVVVGRAPTVDVGSTTTGVTVGRALVDRIALSPSGMKGSSTRSFESMAEVAPTAHTDAYGMSFSGTSSPENQYVIDGLSVNDPSFGLLGTPLSIEFIKEVNVITGGYMPEYGRATGGVLDVVTRSGSNEFHGSVFSSITPGAFEGPRKLVRREGQTIMRETQLSSLRDFGVELGGPILRDKLWFYVGYSPSLISYRLERSLNETIVEDGVIKKDESGFTMTRRIDEATRIYYAEQQSHQYIGKLTYLLSPDHNVSLSVYGVPSFSGGRGTFGIDAQSGGIEGGNLAGTYDALAQRSISVSTDVVLKWASSFMGKALLLDATLGWHNAEASSLPSDGSEMGSGSGLADTAQVAYQRDKNPGYHSITEFERVPAGACVPKPGPIEAGTGKRSTIEVCPVIRYVLGGPGFLREAQLDRYQGKAVVTRLFRALGQHVVKAGVDVELMGYDHQKAYSGGVALREELDGASFQETARYGFLKAPDQPVHIDIFRASTRSTTVGGFVQDSWSILDKVTVNAGVRYDTQVITGADDKVGLSLPNQWSPRVGVIYDFTQAGRSKLFVSFARFYESVPLNIADRSFPGEREVRSYHASPPCDPSTREGQKSPGCTDPENLVRIGTPQNPNQRWQIQSGAKTVVDPEIVPQSTDEIVVGGEYEVFPDGRVGVQYTRRTMNAVIEDMSRDDGMTYFVGNPGRGIAKDFPEARRDYDALTLYLTKAFSDRWLMQASYTLSYLRGNWAGLFQPDTGQLDPNINSDFDLMALLVNREGPLPGDRAHQLKIFGARDFSITKWMNVNVGLTFRTRSGDPTNVFGAHAQYGRGEVYILPRGSGDRMLWVHGFDAHVGLAFDLAEASQLVVGVDAFNLFNFQGVTGRDTEYTSANVLPVKDGTVADLPQRQPDGTYVCAPPACKLRYSEDGAPFDPVDRNPNFGNPTGYQAPRTFRLSAKVMF